MISVILNLFQDLNRLSGRSRNKFGMTYKNGMLAPLFRICDPDDTNLEFKDYDYLKNLNMLNHSDPRIKTEQQKALERFNKEFYRDILITIVVSIAVLLLFSIPNPEHFWRSLILIFVAEFFMLFFRVNVNKLVRLTYDNDKSVLAVSYYNFLDKVKTEQFERHEIATVRISNRRKRISIELKDYRQLKINYSRLYNLEAPKDLKLDKDFKLNEDLR